MKKLSYIFILILLIILGGCVKDSTLIQKTYNHMVKQDKLRFTIEVDHTNTNNEKIITGATYDLNYPSTDDITVFTQKNQMIYYNGSFDNQYIRVEGDKVTLFTHYVNSYVHNPSYTEEKLTRTEWDETNHAVSNLLDNSYFSLLSNYSEILKVGEETLNNQIVSVFKITSDSYNIWSHPYVSYLFEDVIKSSNLEYDKLITSYNKNLEFLVYIDKDSYELRQIEVDLTDPLLSIKEEYSENHFIKTSSSFQNLKKHVIRYKFNAIGEVSVSLPNSFNYYEKTPSDVKEAFNSIWNDSMEKIDAASSNRIHQNLYGKFSTSYTSNNSYTTTNIDLTMEVINNSYIYKKTIGNKSSYFTLENGKYYSYLKEGDTFIKSPIEPFEKVIDVNELIPINKDRLREEVSEAQSDVTYSYTLDYNNLKNNILATELLSKYINDDVNLTDTPEIYISITFNKDKRILKEIKIDYTKFLDSFYVPVNSHDRMDDVDELTLTLTFEQLESVELNTDFMKNPVIDDHVNELTKVDNLTKLTLGESIDASMDYTKDKDVFYFEILDDGKYQFSSSYDELSIIVKSVDTTDKILENDESHFASVLEAGRYYLIVSNSGNTSGSYSVMISKVTDDDYRDEESEINYPIGDLRKGKNISGTIDYNGDIDMFKLDYYYSINLMFGASEGTVLNVYDDRRVLVDSLENGDVFNSYINDHYQSTHNNYLFKVEGTNGTYSLTYKTEYERGTIDYKIGETINDSIVYYGDEDKFTFTVDETTKVLFELENGSISLKNSNGTLIKPFSNLITAELTPGVTYILTVKSSFPPANYTLTSEIISTDDYADDFSETLLSPIIIAGAKTYEGVINSSYDTDLITFDSDEVGLYFISFESSQGLRVTECYDSGSRGYCNYVTLDPDFPLAIDTSLSNSPDYFEITSSTGETVDYSFTVDKYDETQDLPDNIDENNIPTYQILEPLPIVFHGINDEDVFKLEVTETGYYQFNMFNQRLNKNNQFGMKIYDLDLNQLYDFSMSRTSYTPYLEKGNYIIKLDNLSFDYFELNTTLLIDDQTSTTNLGVINDPVETNGSIDHYKDTDTFTFTVDTDGLYLLEHQGENAKLETSEGIYVTSIAKETKVYLYQGEYAITFYSNSKLGDYTMTISNIGPFTDDTGYSKDLDPSLLKAVQIGDNEISVDYRFDWDVYTFDVSEAGKYHFTTDANDIYNIYNQAGDSVVSGIYSNNYKLADLTPGRYYIVFHVYYEGIYNLSISKE